MIEFKVTTIEAERTRGHFCNPVTKWSYMITTGSRCRGLVSKHKYTCPIKAAEAGERMIKKLEGVSK